MKPLPKTPETPESSESDDADEGEPQPVGAKALCTKEKCAKSKAALKKARMLKKKECGCFNKQDEPETGTDDEPEPT